MDTASFKKKLIESTRLLLYSSESDYPFELLDLGKKESKQLQSYIASLPAPVEHISARDFFNKYINILEKNGDKEMKKIAERYKKLQNFLSTNASDVSVWRSGKIQVGIYILISTREGLTFVLKTTSIET